MDISFHVTHVVIQPNRYNDNKMKMNYFLIDYLFIVINFFKVDDTLNYLASHDIKPMDGELRASMNSTSSEKLGATYGMLWFDIEGTDYWSTSTSSNANFLQSMVNEAVARGVHVGKDSFSFNTDDLICYICN